MANESDSSAIEHSLIPTNISPRAKSGLLRAILKWVGVALLIFAVIYGGASWIFSSKLIADQFPAEEAVTFSDFGLPDPENVVIDSGDTQLAGWYFANPAHAGCGVIMLHGYTGNKAEVLSISPLFWDRGCDLFLYDLRGHGQSSEGMHTYGVKDKDDELAALDVFKQRSGLVEGQIGLIGWSYGAATSLMTAAARPGLAFVISDASYSSLKDIANAQAEKMYGSWAKLFVPGALFVSRFRADFDPADASPEDAIKKIDVPVLLIQSTTDEFTPYEQTEKIYANSNQDLTTYVLTEYGAPHARSYGTDVVAYTRFVDEFLAKFVPTFGTPRA